MAKVKQRKATTYIYSMKDNNGMLEEGFEDVGNIISSYYKELLGSQDIYRAHIDLTVISPGSVLIIEGQLQLYKPFNDHSDNSILYTQSQIP